jgi:hypothetical protein
LQGIIMMLALDCHACRYCFTAAAATDCRKRQNVGQVDPNFLSWTWVDVHQFYVKTVAWGHKAILRAAHHRYRSFSDPVHGDMQGPEHCPGHFVDGRHCTRRFLAYAVRQPQL